MSGPVRQSIEIDATPEQVYDVIVDFERYPSFVPNQSGARIVKQEENRWEVEFELQIVKRLTYNLKLTGVPGKSLRWQLVRGDMMKKNDGGWTLEELPGGRTKATYDIEVAVKGFVPKAISTKLVATTLPENLKAFKGEIERRAS
ncbi:MAG: type II toxin-antitoxin system RatA family toxin [Bradymonadia bacterium]